MVDIDQYEISRRSMIIGGGATAVGGGYLLNRHRSGTRGGAPIQPSILEIEAGETQEIDEFWEDPFEAVVFKGDGAALEFEEGQSIELE